MIGLAFRRSHRLQSYGSQIGKNPATLSAGADDTESNAANGGLRREPGLEPHKDIAPEKATSPPNEFDLDLDDDDQDVVRIRTVNRRVGNLARQASMDPGDGMKL